MRLPPSSLDWDSLGVSWIYTALHEFGGIQAPIALVVVMLFTPVFQIPRRSNLEDADVQFKVRHGSGCGCALRGVESSFPRIQSRFQLCPQVSDVCDEAR